MSGICNKPICLKVSRKFRPPASIDIHALGGTGLMYKYVGHIDATLQWTPAGNVCIYLYIHAMCHHSQPVREAQLCQMHSRSDTGRSQSNLQTSDWLGFFQQGEQSVSTNTDLFDSPKKTCDMRYVQWVLHLVLYWLLDHFKSLWNWMGGFVKC